jgi:hypothetical protein
LRSDSYYTVIIKHFWHNIFGFSTQKIFCNNILSETHHSPVVVDLLEGDGVEDDARHHLGEDGPVLDKVVVVLGRLLVDDGHYPLQHLVLQLQITLKKAVGIFKFSIKIALYCKLQRVLSFKFLEDKNKETAGKV